MSSAQKVLALLFVVIAIANASIIVREPRILPPIECVSHNDCRPGSCCVMHMSRYNYPSCQEQPEEGDFCHPRPIREMNTTRYYPDGIELELQDVYYSICPCSIGLACDAKNAVCRDANEM